MKAAIQVRRSMAGILEPLDASAQPSNVRVTKRTLCGAQHRRVDPAIFALALQLQVGDLATVDMGAGDRRCARVPYIDLRPSGVEWYWLVLEQESPRPVVRARPEQLQPGCDERSAGTK